MEDLQQVFCNMIINTLTLLPNGLMIPSLESCGREGRDSFDQYYMADVTLCHFHGWTIRSDTLLCSKGTLALRLHPALRSPTAFPEDSVVVLWWAILVEPVL